MDFNIVTFHTAYNQGAVLQTLALQEFIKERGYSVGVYDYRPHFVNPVSGTKGKIFKLLTKLYEKDYLKNEERFQEFVNSNLNLNLEMDSKIFLSGSDQVWNPTGTMDPIYFLQFVGDNSLRASYAASMGTSKIPDESKELFKRYINRFDMVSVRESDVKDCISEFYANDISVNVDPTLLMKAEFWKQYMREVPNIPEKFILAYILHFPKNANVLLKWLQKEIGAKVVLIDGQGVMTHLVHNDIALHNVGPREFLWLVDHSKAVVTSSFHGTAFSVIFHKEFYSIVNPASPSRINNILNLLKLKPINEMDNSFVRNDKVEWKFVDSILCEERKKSDTYIRSLYEYSLTKFRSPVKGTVSIMKERCTGCSACESSCQINAIKMVLNNEGFYEPSIDETKCINCSKCLKTCPLDKKIGTLKKKSYYGWHKDPNVCFSSSSGGIFRGLSDGVISRGGIVFGAIYSDEWKSVVFEDSDHVSLEAIQKSKYTVSNPSGIYKRIKEQLDSGREVLFCGTPCQCAGLTQFLEKPYSNLLRIDFVCGGMASLAFYREHLKFLEEKYNSTIESLDFRPKKWGWGKQRIQVCFKNNKEYHARSHMDVYFKCFANEHVSVREICLGCEFYSYHVSDITLADFWGYKTAGVKKNKKGISLIVANTVKGITTIESNNDLELKSLDSKHSDYAFRSKSPNMKQVNQRNTFFKRALTDGFEDTANSLYKVSETAHIKAAIKVKFKI